ncbi:hypothetical protein JCM1841_002237 [Sporobolomyces salmonicolor]
MGLPPDNPYTAALSALQDELYPTPSSGFKTRSVVLQTLTALYLFGAGSYLFVLVADARRRIAAGLDDGLWLFRRVERTKGDSYVVANVKLSLVLFTLLNGAVEFAYLATQSWVYFLHAPRIASFAFRSFFWIPLFLQGWLLVWGALQAFVLNTGEGIEHRWVPKAWTANWLFIGGGTGICAAGIAAGVINTLTSSRLWTHYTALSRALQTLESSYTAGLAPTTISNMVEVTSPYVSAIQDTGRAIRRTMLATWAVVLGATVLLVLIAVAGLALASNLPDHLRPTRPRHIRLTSLPQPPAVSTRFGLAVSSKEAEERARTVVAERERGVRKATRELIVTLATLAFSYFLLACVLNYVVALCALGRLFTASWTLLEPALFGPSYLYSSLSVVVFASLLYSHYVRPSSASALPPAPSPAFTPTPPSSTDSLPLGQSRPGLRGRGESYESCASYASSSTEGRGKEREEGDRVGHLPRLAWA